jgi:DNA-binding NarL/FixJ family response regulator
MGARRRKTPACVADLGAEDRAVLDQLLEGETLRGIADQMHRSRGAVQHRVLRIYGRLGVRNRLQLCRALCRMGYFTCIEGGCDGHEN